MLVAEQKPTLTALAKHIRRNIVPWWASDWSLKETFFGSCHEAATWLEHLLTGEWYGPAYRRGWYSGEITAMDTENGRHCHSWVEIDGKILDPTWWAFTDAKPGIYIFPANDSRYQIDSEAH